MLGYYHIRTDHLGANHSKEYMGYCIHMKLYVEKNMSHQSLRSLNLANSSSWSARVSVKKEIASRAMKLTSGTEGVVLGYCARVHIQEAGIDHLGLKLAQCPLAYLQLIPQR